MRSTSPASWLGSTSRSEKAKATGRFDYDAEIEGLRALDRYTIRLKLVEPDYTLMDSLPQAAMAAVAREVIEAYGDASGWAMAQSGGDRPVPPEGMAPRAEDRARSQSELPRGVLSRRAGEDGRSYQGDRHADEGEAAAADRPRRDLDHRGIESAAARVQLEARSTTQTFPPISCRGRSIRATGCCRNTRKRACGSSARSSRRSLTRTSTWKTRSSAAIRRTRSRCGARS